MNLNTEYLNKIADNNLTATDLKKQGQYHEAIKLLNENVKLNTHTPATYTELADIYNKQGKYDKEYEILLTGYNRIKDLKNVNNNIKKDMKNRIDELKKYDL